MNHLIPQVVYTPSAPDELAVSLFSNHPFDEVNFDRIKSEGDIDGEDDQVIKTLLFTQSGNNNDF
jgi:hypothetical protein